MTKEQRKRQLKRRKFVAKVVAAGLISGLALGYVMYDRDHLTFEEIQQEIDIHSGVGLTPDGHYIDPFYEHGCEVPNDGRLFEERLADKMLEEGYSQKTIEAAIDKFNLQCDKDFDMAKDIDLRKIEKEAKENKMTSLGR